MISYDGTYWDTIGYSGLHIMQYIYVCVHIHVCILIYVYMLISPYMLYNIKVVQQLYNIYGQISGSDDPPSL